MTANKIERPALDTRQLGVKSLTVGSLTGGSRVLGLVREIVFSYTFGASLIADAFFVAFRIPNFFRRLLAEGAFAQAFVPVLAQYQGNKQFDELQLFVRTIAGNFGLSLLVICALGVALAPALITVFTFGAWHGDEQQGLATSLLMIMFSYLGLISFTAFLGSILNSFGRFSIPSFSPIVLNVAIILAALLGSIAADQPVYLVAWSVIVAGVVQLLLHLPSLIKLRLFKLPKLDWKHVGVQQLLKLLGPAVYAASAGQINILVGTGLAALLTTGSVSWLYYADRLIELPVGMIAIAIQTVVLPRFSYLYDRKEYDEYRAGVRWSLELGILLGVPATLGLSLLAVPLVATIFYHGEFNSIDLQMVARALQAFSIGVLPLMLVRMLAPAFFAQQNTKTPFKYTTISVATNIIVSVSLFKLIGHVGIAIATSVAAIVHIVLLVQGLIKRNILSLNRELFFVCLRVGGAGIAMSLFLVLLRPEQVYWFESSAWDRVVWLFLLVSTGTITYFGVCFILGLRPRRFIGQRDQRIRESH